MQPAQFQLHAEIEDRHWWFVARRQILCDVIASILPPSPETTVIDVGCGTGANLAALADSYQCIGIDASPQAIRLAKQRFPNVRFIHGMAPRDLGDSIERASLVLLTDVLEHVADDFAMFSQLLAATTPGTYFLITVPADLGLWSEHDKTFGHYRRYDAERLERLWEGLPVRPVFVSHFNSRLYPLVKLARGFNRWRGHSSGIGGTDFVLPTTRSNSVLARCFAGERHRLCGLARGEKLPPFRHGVSLMALIERRGGPVEPRFKPANVAEDIYDPSQELVTSSA